MTQLETAILEVAETLESLSLPYMLVGGLAVSMWDTPRATLDVDVSVWVEPDEFEDTVLRIAGLLHSRSEDPVAFARRTRVLPAEASKGIRVDIIFASLPFEQDMIERAVGKRLSGKTIPVVSLEDLILMKLVSERGKDLDDARLLLRYHRESLDTSYLEPRLLELAKALVRPDIMRTFRAARMEPGGEEER